nr:mucin-5AC-like [Dermacentor andersoni]XP_054918166.1 mucin-5AC-like [Dermacentor andersoni]
MDSGGSSCTCKTCDDCLKRLRDGSSSQAASTKRPELQEAEQSTREEGMDTASDVREAEEAQRRPSTTSTSTDSSASSFSSPSTETTALTLSIESRQLSSSSEKAASKSATTGALAGTHPRLSSATLSSGSMAEYSADDEMSVSSRTSALAESLSLGPFSQGTVASGSLRSSSSGTGAAAMAPPAEGAEALGTLSEVTFPSASPDDCFLPPEATTLSQTAPALAETNPDQSEATQPPTSEEPQSPMDVSGSEGTTSAGFSFGHKVSSGLPLTGTSVESYAQSTVSATGMSVGSDETVADATDANVSSAIFDEPSVMDESASAGRDPAKPAPAKLPSPQRRPHVKDLDHMRDEDR